MFLFPLRAKFAIFFIRSGAGSYSCQKIGVAFTDPTKTDRQGYTEFCIFESVSSYEINLTLSLYGGPTAIAFLLSQWTFSGSGATFSNKRMYRVQSSFSTEDKGTSIIAVYGYKY